MSSSSSGGPTSPMVASGAPGTTGSGSGAGAHIGAPPPPPPPTGTGTTSGNGGAGQALLQLLTLASACRKVPQQLAEHWYESLVHHITGSIPYYGCNCSVFDKKTSTCAMPACGGYAVRLTRLILRHDRKIDQAQMSRCGPFSAAFQCRQKPQLTFCSMPNIAASHVALHYLLFNHVCPSRAIYNC